MRTPSVSFLVTLSSIQLPRSGMTRQACSLRSPASISTTKSTPGRAVELADDDALGAVDDELAAADHDRHVAQVDRFLDGRLALVQAEPDAERAAVGQAELAALVGLVARLAQVVLDVFQLERLVVALDREDFAEDPFQARVGALLGRDVGLEEPLVAAGLDLGQVGDRELVVDPAEIPWLGGVIRRTVVAVGMIVALLKGRWWAPAAGRDRRARPTGRGRRCLATTEVSPGRSTLGTARSRHPETGPDVGAGADRVRTRAAVPDSTRRRPPRHVADARSMRVAEAVAEPESIRAAAGSLDLDRGAGLFQLLLELLGVLLGDAGLDRLGGRLDQVLGLLQAQAGGGADDLDDVDLVGAEGLEDARRTRSGRRRARRRRRRRRPGRRPTAAAAALMPWTSSR